ncbi:MAG: polysaccharide deacetylase family protein [Fimbriimonadaceae bacterium]|nr:polysaccharide deacetylase family protein [Fimbriimonadaceae bacterium]
MKLRPVWLVLAVGLALAPLGAAGPKRCAITIDDGPRPDFIPAALDLFDRYGVKVTFYNVGQNVKAYPKLTAECARRGHEIANHSYSHPVLPRLSAAGIRSELERTSAAIEAVTGRPVEHLRPPYGAVSSRVRQVAKELGLTVDLWTIDPLDWQGSATADRTASRVLSHLHSDAVILIHEVQPTLRALPAILDGLRERGYEVLTYGELQALTAQDEPGAQRTITIECGAGDDDRAKLGRGCGYALERGLRAAAPPGWSGDGELRFKLLVPRAVSGTLQVLLTGAKTAGQCAVTLNGAALGTFSGGQRLKAAVTPAETAHGELLVTVRGAQPQVGLVTFDAQATRR